MLGKLVLLTGLVCLAEAAQKPNLVDKKQLRVFQKGKESTQVQSSLSSTDCEPNSKKANPLNRQTYFQCTVNGLALMKCPDTMVFETASSACIRDNTPPHGAKAPTCPPNLLGLDPPTYFPGPTCDSFYQCSNGTPYLIYCPAGLYFNPSINACDWPRNVPSCGGGGGWSGTTKSNSIENSEADEENKSKGKWGEK